MLRGTPPKKKKTKSVYGRFYWDKRRQDWNAGLVHTSQNSERWLVFPPSSPPPPTQAANTIFRLSSAVVLRSLRAIYLPLRMSLGLPWR